MPSERRLHPASFLFAIAGQLRQFLLPGLVVIITAGAAGGEFEPWLMAAVIPVAVVALGRALSYRYRLDETELVVRTGFVFRNERHIPYSRIQNIEAIQNVVHRLLAVIEVRIETGAGKEDDATMRVVPVAAIEYWPAGRRLRSRRLRPRRRARGARSSVCRAGSFFSADSSTIGVRSSSRRRSGWSGNWACSMPPSICSSRTVRRVGASFGRRCARLPPAERLACERWPWPSQPCRSCSPR
jgi:membrane protein YdbS with pleckstrin-like domain